MTHFAEGIQEVGETFLFSEQNGENTIVTVLGVDGMTEIEITPGIIEALRVITGADTE